MTERTPRRLSPHARLTRLFRSARRCALSAPLSIAAIWVLLAPAAAPAAELAGRLPGEFAVTPGGSATYRIPIETPAATGGLRPRLAITYNHQTGNGLLGMRWNLSGLSAVTRCPRTLEQDGDTGGITFSASSRFCLDGQRLVSVGSGSYGANATQYRTEVESFSRIFSYGTAGFGPQKFYVITPDGGRHYYGYTASSRIEAQGKTDVLVWALSYSLDRFNNRIDYLYNENSSTGEFEVSRIEYTTNSALGLASPRYTVDFTYETRPSADQRSGYIGTSVWTRSKRLKTIAVKNAGNLIHEYKLTYATAPNTERSRLTSVQQCRATTCLPATTFLWSNAVQGWSTTAVTGPTAVNASDALVGDFNGDGMQDLFYHESGVWKVVKGQSNGNFSGAVNTGKAAHNVSSTRLFDYNGDGYSDLLVKHTDGNWHVYRSTGSGFTDVNTNISWSGTSSPMVLDVNGDGRGDLLYVASSTLYLRINNGSFGAAQAVYPASVSGQMSSYYLGMRRGADFNGDGRADFLSKKVTVTWVFGEPIFTTSWEAFWYDGTNFSRYHDLGQISEPRVIDINADGLDDIAYVSGSWWHTRLSTGGGFTSATSTGISSANAADALIGDYNGDGREDLIRTDTTNLFGYKSTGTTLSSSAVNLGGPHTANRQARVMDVDGDSHLDIVIADGAWKVRRHNSDLSDVVTKITDGLDNEFSPTYQPLSTSSSYTQTSGSASYPERKFRGPQYVVTSYQRNDGTGGSYTVSYHYYDAKVHQKGRGFLGFGRIRATDSRNNSYVETTYIQQWPRIGNVELTQFRQSNGKKIRVTNPNWGVFGYSGGTGGHRKFVYLDWRHTEFFEVGGSLDGLEIRDLSENFTYNNTYGHLTNVSRTTTSPYFTGSFTTTEAITATNLTGPWCLGLPTRIDVTRSAPGAANETRTVQRTYNSSTCRMLTQNVGPAADQSLQLKTTLVYDGYGNVTSVRENAANGAAGDERRVDIAYDGWGHLPISQTAVISGEANHTSSQTWDYKLLRELSFTDVDGLTTSWSYDVFGRLTQENPADGPTTNVSYSAWASWTTGNKLKVQLSRTDGFLSDTFLDAYGRSLGSRHKLPGGSMSYQVITYDALGRPTTVRVPYVHGETHYNTTYTYDLLGRTLTENRPVSESQTSGSLTTWSYQGLATHVTDAEGKTKIYEVDPLGRLVKLTDPSPGGITQYEYNAFGELDKTIDPASNAITMSYNNRGFKTAMTDPDTGNSSYTYNVWGELETRTDAKSQTTKLTYDQLGRLRTRVEPEGTTSWTYSTTGGASFGKLASVTSPGGFAESYSYDTLGRTSQVVTTLDSTAYTTNYAYDTHGRLSKLTYPTSTSGYRHAVDYLYDTHGYLSSIRNTASPTEVYWTLNEADALGRERMSTLASGITEIRTYDRAAGYLEEIEIGPSMSASIEHLAYTWDKVGNMLTRQDLRQSKTESFAYDNLHRLTSATVSGQTPVTLAYNAIGNITSKSDVGTYSYGAGAAGPHSVTSTSGTRTGTYAYDANGNMTSHAGNSIAWTSYDKPRTINQGTHKTELYYGADRARYKQVRKTGSTTDSTVYYIGPHFEKETAGSTTTYRHNLRAAGQTVAVYERGTGGNAVRYLHRDGLGSVVSLTSSSGSSLQRLSYDIFGKRRNTNWTADPTDSLYSATQQTERGYTGHEHLDNVKLVHMGGRVQDPILGRFLSADPTIPYPESSQSFNRYSYVQNNPTSRIDPSGFTDRGFSLDEGRQGNGGFIWIYTIRGDLLVRSTLNGPPREPTNEELRRELSAAANSQPGANPWDVPQPYPPCDGEGDCPQVDLWGTFADAWRLYWREMLRGAISGAEHEVTTVTRGIVPGDMLAEMTGVKPAVEGAISTVEGDYTDAAVKASEIFTGKIRPLRNVLGRGNSSPSDQVSNSNSGIGLEGRGVTPAPGERTVQGQVDAAVEQAGGNVTVQRGGQDLVRLRSRGHGQSGATATPQNVRNVTPDGDVFFGKGPDRAVSPRDIRELYKGQTGQGSNTLRTRGGG